MRYFKVKDFLENKLGIEAVVYKSGPHKDMASPFRAANAEEEVIFHNMIEEMYLRFLEVVQEGRNGIPQEELRKIADGRVYTAKQALKLKLVDGIGYFEDAIKKAIQLANLDSRDYQLIYYQQPRSLLEKILEPSVRSSFSYEEIAYSLLQDLQNPGFYYLWKPSFPAMKER